MIKLMQIKLFPISRTLANTVHYIVMKYLVFVYWQLAARVQLLILATMHHKQICAYFVNVDS